MEAAKRRKQRLVALMHQAKAKPCADCGQQFPYYVMDFDHRPGESKNRAYMYLVASQASQASLLAEIAKCDVVCANCHRERSHCRKQARGQALL
jgi:hypothetical protein